MKISLIALALVVGLWSTPTLAASIQGHPPEPTSAPQILSGVAAIAEPSPMTLLGVGVLLVLQAIPHRPLRSRADAARVTGRRALPQGRWLRGAFERRRGL